jgi:uncharacterized protein
MSRIDIFNHVMPSAYLEALKQHSRDPGIVRRMTSLRMLWDIEARVEMLKQWPDLKQVLTLAVPSPELLSGPELSPELARLANDGMAEMCRKWPDRFPTFAASLPMNNVAAAVDEMDRAIGTLGACGVQILTSVNGRALRPSSSVLPRRMASPFGCTRSARVAAPTILTRRRRNTRFGRCSVGRSRAASPWHAWCSRDSSSVSQASASSRIIAAA